MTGEPVFRCMVVVSLSVNMLPLPGEDGCALLQALYDVRTPAYLQQLPGVQILRQVWLQQYVVENSKIQYHLFAVN